MSSDPNKKSPRTFQCRDMLWETFEQMARELECSVDYLINEAMKQYARQRSYGGRTPYPNAAERAAQRAAADPGRRPQSMPPLPGAQQSYNGSPMGSPSGAQLSIIYQGEKVAVAKDRFVIGRGKQSSDLTLKDPNVSRQHAMIEYQNGVYFMVDMGSTNGVEYNGQRIARKQIAEGDVFRICDHDLRFTYR